MGLKNTYQSRKRFTKVPVSKTGMWYQDGDVVVPSNQITMKGPNGESDYFNSPIMGTGMQSGQTQVMYPGREYSFPNDNSVYETKMQGGGISGNSELALDLASMIPGPVGMMASGLGLFNDLYQGDLVGAGLNTANILTGGTSKGLMSVARLASNAGARNAANVLAAGSRNLNRTSRIVNNYTKPVDTTRNVLNPSANYSTQFGGYEDNNRKNIPTRPDWYTTEDWDRSVDQYNYRNRPKMQSGGLFPVGPYDEMMAPKQGNYLQPDINRPYYIDDFGGMRSEYKMGFNDNGKETLIPTVVNGRQLTEDQAIDNYFKTGLNMGKYNSVDDAEYASKMRTAKYNMFQDPVRFQMQKGGRTPIYVSDPDDPRLKAYNDSTDAYDFGVRSIKEYNAAIKKGKEKGTPLKNIPKKHNQGLAPWTGTNIMPIETNHASPTGTPYGSENSDFTLWTGYTKFKKPVQPVQYKPAQKQVSYPNQPIGTGMKRSISKNVEFKPDPKIVAKQQQLIDAGYNIGTADGIWGKKSQQAWDQMSTPKQSEVNMSFETPVMKVKGMTEENIGTLKNQYKENTGSNFKSQDNVFNNLQKSLGRRPTVTEYNKAIQQYNSSVNSMRNGGWLNSYQIGGKTSTEQNPDKIASIDIKSKMPRVDWYESIDPRNWNLRDYSAVDDYGTAYQRAKLSGQDEFYWKGKRYNTKYAGPINEEIATYGVKGQKVNSKDYITVYQYPYLDRDYFPSHIAADQSAQIAKLASFENSDWDKSEKFFDYVQTQMQPNTPYRTISDEESLIYNPPKINYGPSGNMRGIQDDMSLSGRKEYRVYGVDPVTFFKKSQELDREIYKSIGHNWNLVTNNCADNVCDAFGVPRDKFITTPQDAIENISKKYPTLEVTGRKTYQVGGETSTEQNPERINPVYIEKSKSFFDKAAGKYRNFMRSFLSNDVGRNLYLNYTTAKDAVGMVTNPITKTIGETIPKDFLFNRVRPVDYPESNPLLFAFDTYMRLGDKGAPPLKDAKGNYAPSEEIWRKALGYNDSFNYIEPSQYRPSKTKENDNAEYVRFKNLYDPQKIINAYVKAQKTLPSDKTSTVIPSLDPYITNRENLEASGLAFSQQDPLQNFTLDKGQDEKGKYISLYDKYDFSGPANNLIYGFRKPVEIYDRMYYEKDKRGRPVYKKEKGGLQMSYLKTKRFK